MVIYFETTAALHKFFYIYVVNLFFSIIFTAFFLGIITQILTHKIMMLLTLLCYCNPFSPLFTNYLVIIMLILKTPF